MLVRVWNELMLELSASINWRTSLVPAPAVIPAPVAYSNVVAFKTLVFGFQNRWHCSAVGCRWSCALRCAGGSVPRWSASVDCWGQVPIVLGSGTADKCPSGRVRWCLGEQCLVVWLWGRATSVVPASAGLRSGFVSTMSVPTLVTVSKSERSKRALFLGFGLGFCSNALAWDHAKPCQLCWWWRSQCEVTEGVSTVVREVKFSDHCKTS